MIYQDQNDYTKIKAIMIEKNARVGRKRHNKKHKKNMLNMFSKHDISTHKHSTYGICAVHFGLNFIVNIWVFPKIGLPPNHPF